MTTTLEAERRTILATIIDHPDDDTPRLILADWLEDNHDERRCDWCEGKGDERVADAAGDMDDERCRKCGGIGRVSNGYRERSELIRFQIEIANLSGRDRCDHDTNEKYIGCRECELRERERELLQKYESTWALSGS